ncbi:MAG: NAD-dependent epimerase/dehydratase family protein [Gammaproteobacteria bacterium]
MRVGTLVVGCGYLGTALVRRLGEADRPVYFTVRTQTRMAALARELPHAHGITFDTADTSKTTRVLMQDVIDALDVYCVLTPSALATPVLRERLFAWLRTLPVRRAVLSSSTGIHGERGGATVGPETPVEPTTPRQQRLLDIEQAWLSETAGRIVRLAGLYGPGRVIGLGAVREGEVLPGQPMAWLNLLQRDDAVEALCASMRADSAARIELASDGTPLRRAAYYTALAAMIRAPAPRFADPPDPDRCGKAVDPRVSFARLGWSPQCVDFRVGLHAALATG